jgi:hypothetical protein
MLRKTAVAVTAIALTGALAMPGPAIAGNGNDDSYGLLSCTFLAAIGTPNNGGVDDVFQDRGLDDNSWDIAQLQDTDGGNWSMQTNVVTCAGKDTAGNTIGPIAGNNFTLTAGLVSAGGVGVYTNLICGAAWMLDGTADLTSPGTNLSLSLGMVVKNGKATLAINRADGTLTVTQPVSPEGLALANPQDIDNGSGIGKAKILPAVGNCVNMPVLEWTIVGSFKLWFSGDENPYGPDPLP